MSTIASLKEFIYLDEDFLKSFIAQSNKGLPTTISLENQESETTTSNKENTKERAVSIGGKADSGKIDIQVISTPNVKGEAAINFKKTMKNGFSLSQLEAAKEIITKQLHDNALNEFEQLIKEKRLIIDLNTNFSPLNGSFVKFTSTFKVIDISLIREIFNEPFILSLLTQELNTEKSKQIKLIDSNTNLPKKQKDEAIKQINQTYKKIISEQEQLMNQIKDVTSFLKKVMPTEIYLKMGNLVSPLKENSMRKNPKEIKFLFGDNGDVEVTLIGKVTRKYEIADEKTDDNEFNNAMKMFNSGIEQAINVLGVISIDDFIVSPIAIYLE